MESGGSCSSPEIREKTYTEATENTEFTEKRKRNAGKENQSADRKAGIGWPRPRRKNNRPRPARRRHGTHLPPPSPDPGDDRLRRHSGRRRRHRPFHPLGRS